MSKKVPLPKKVTVLWGKGAGNTFVKKGFPAENPLCFYFPSSVSRAEISLAHALVVEQLRRLAGHRDLSRLKNIRAIRN